MHFTRRGFDMLDKTNAPLQEVDKEWVVSSQNKKGLAYIALVIWFALSLVGLASLSVNHIFAMPIPKDEVKVTRSIWTLRKGQEPYFVVHVIYQNCSCTESLFAHLLQRGRFPKSEELILFVGENDGKKKKALEKGFRFLQSDATHLEVKYGLESAPVLLVFDGRGQMRYIGGYYNHPSAIFPLDVKVFEQVNHQKAPKTLPIFGCAVRRGVQKSMDPFGLVY